jgi:hypothetical protein
LTFDLMVLHIQDCNAVPSMIINKASGKVL